MKIPSPRPGLVIRYGFLWSDEADAGAEEGAKDRPCAVIVAAKTGGADDITTIVAPITHNPPDAPDGSIEIPPDVCAKLGLDGGRHWIRLDELNRFLWPGFDLRPIPGGDDVAYGMLPRDLFETMKQQILHRAGRPGARRPTDRG